VEQVGSPMELYLTPDNLFVAKFIGSPAMNTVPCTIESEGTAASVKPDNGRSVKGLAAIPAGQKGKKGTFGVRPEDITLTSGADAIFTGTIDIVEKLGEVTLLYVDCGDPEEPVIAKIDGIAQAQKGEKVGLTAPVDCLHVFDENGHAFRRPNGHA